MAKVSILVKSEGMLSKGLNLATTPVWKLGKRLKEADQVVIQLDGEYHFLEASTEPHIIDVQPGRHSIVASDIDEGKKFGFGAAMKTAIRIGVNLTGGGSITGAIAEGVSSAKDSHDRAVEKHSKDEFQIFEGETVEYTCQASANGVVKLKRIR